MCHSNHHVECRSEEDEEIFSRGFIPFEKAAKPTPPAWASALIKATFALNESSRALLKEINRQENLKAQIVTLKIMKKEYEEDLKALVRDNRKRGIAPRKPMEHVLEEASQDDVEPLSPKGLTLAQVYFKPKWVDQCIKRRENAYSRIQTTKLPALRSQLAESRTSLAQFGTPGAASPWPKITPPKTVSSQTGTFRCDTDSEEDESDTESEEDESDTESEEDAETSDPESGSDSDHNSTQDTDEEDSEDEDDEDDDVLLDSFQPQHLARISLKRTKYQIIRRLSNDAIKQEALKSCFGLIKIGVSTFEYTRNAKTEEIVTYKFQCKPPSYIVETNNDVVTVTGRPRVSNY